MLLVLAALVTYAAPLSPLANSLTSAAPVSTATRAGRLAVFDDAWSTIHERYYDRTFHGLDWDAQRNAFRDLAGDADSGYEFYAVLRRMIGVLKDPHTRVFSPEEKFDWWQPRYVTIGLGVKEIDGGVTVVGVEPDSAPARTGIVPGDLIESVDGQPVTALLSRRLISTTGNATARRRAFSAIFEGAAGTALELGWKDKQGKNRQARFDRYWQQRELGLSLNREGDYVVIAIDGFTKPIARSFARTVPGKLNGARGVIIDLRRNGGGDAEAMAEIASLFLGTGVSLGDFADRSGRAFTISTSLSTAEPFSAGLPIVVLTSERTASAAEIFVAALRQAKRATVIGTQTCGCVLAIRTRHNLPDGGMLDVSELDYRTPAGERLEGNGIQPDQTVLVHRKDLYAKRDTLLEQALTRLRRLKN